MPAEKPKGSTEEAAWLEVHEAALFLDAAKGYQPKGVPWVYPMIATMLLSGGRRVEVLGLEVDDVRLERKTVTFRPNKWRRLKTKRSRRSVQLWPPLERILRESFPVREQMGGGTLLFPSYHARVEAMVTNVQKPVNAVAERAGWKRGEITPKMFRHTYISARIQTTQHGKPVAAYTVAREVGHSSTAMIEKTYGHLGEVQHRSTVVEYRVEQHKQAVARLRHALRHAAGRVA
jgi:integrase